MSGEVSLDEVNLEDIDRCLVCASTDHSEILEGNDTLHGLPGRWSVAALLAAVGQAGRMTFVERKPA
ncbi:MAG: hypothetical protein IFK93_15460 [Acidobacteria bacterium]|nr:hypothetical protein [Candidatus Sulfomarinibacter kjeldsenii]